MILGTRIQNMLRFTTRGLAIFCRRNARQAQQCDDGDCFSKMFHLCIVFVSGLMNNNKASGPAFL